MNKDEIKAFLDPRKHPIFVLDQNHVVFKVQEGINSLVLEKDGEQYYIKLANGNIVVHDGRGNPVDTTGKDERPGCSNRYCYNWAEECEKHDNSRLLEQ